MAISLSCLLGLVMTVTAGPSYVAASNPCWGRQYAADSIVCVCNSTYCDDLPPIQKTSVPVWTYISYTSSRNGSRFAPAKGSFTAGGEPFSTADYTFTLSGGTVGNAQTVHGFGGAFTDSAVINILSLSPPAQDNLLRSYFSSFGSEYNMGRVPIAATDDSTHWYSYDDFDGDFELSNFSLAPEDYNMKIPVIERAQAFAEEKLLIFASPWSSPGWMKTTGQMNGTAELKGPAGSRYSRTWANYLVRFIQAYESSGNITIWGLTVQNEPGLSTYVTTNNGDINQTAETQRDFIAEDLGPALTAAGLRRIKLMILDDSRFFLPKFADTVLAGHEAAKYVDGIAVHWYMDPFGPPSVLTETHKKNPNIFILSTEACNGVVSTQPHVVLGDWSRGEAYAADIFENLQNWVTGWVDWNIALNTQGGPNQIENNLDSPVIVNTTADEFYKQPMYYTLAHFSKFIPKGSLIIQGEQDYIKDVVKLMNKQMFWYERGLQVTAAQRPDGGITLVSMNKSPFDLSLKIADGRLQRGYFVDVIPARSIRTFVWF